MPLLARMNIPGCRYISDNSDDIVENRRDWEVVPMAANLQIVVALSKNTGKLYRLVYLNEVLVDTSE